MACWANEERTTSRARPMTTVCRFADSSLRLELFSISCVRVERGLIEIAGIDAPLDRRSTSYDIETNTWRCKCAATQQLGSSPGGDPSSLHGKAIAVALSRRKQGFESPRERQ